MRQLDVTAGLRVRSPRRPGGTCTGQVSVDRLEPVGLTRAEVRWDTGDVTWPLVSILEPLPGVTP